jgi:hypothetical protein
MKTGELEKLCSLNFHFKEVNSQLKKLGVGMIPSRSRCRQFARKAKTQSSIHQCHGTERTDA